MRTEVDASAARIKKKKRSSERSKRHDRPLDDEGGRGEWKQFTSPDGHPYYYNAVTKESRWEPPTEEQSKHLRPKGSSKQMDMKQDTPLNEAPAKKEKKKRPESRRSATEEAPAVRTSKNAMFQKLQASLEGRLNGAMMGRPPPMLDIRQGEVERQQEEKKTPSLEEQYEAETAGMSAAERLRFLRKKRQEDMMARRESVAGDDFMAEVANNMKKKGKSKEEKDSGEKGRSWKEQEQVEEERKRQQMQEEMEAKKQEKEIKEQEEQEARERELRREQERAEQVALEERREQERRQRQEEEDRRRLEKEEKRKKRKEKKNSADLEERSSERDDVAAREKDATESDAQGIGAQDEAFSDAPSPERVRHRSRSRSRGSKRGSSARSLQYENENAKAAASTKDDHSPVEDGHSALSEEVASDPVLYEKQRAREERRARKLREKELTASKRTESATSESQRRKSVSSAGNATEDSSTRTTSSAEAEEEARAIEKQLRREKRRVAKLEAALAAQSLDGDHGNVQHERFQAEHTEQYATSSNGSTPGSAHAGNYPMNDQNPPLSGGMYAPYPYMMMPPPPPPTPYGYYYPYMQPPPMMPAPMYPPGMVGVPPGYQLVPPTPPPSSDGMATPSAMVPYSAESTLESAYGMPFGSMYGQQSAPELSRCDCCQGIGVGLVEKNGVCGHCNRLRLAFIVDSAQMRQRCSVCGGWGFQLLQENGMCEHCIRLSSQKSRRRSSAATPLAARAPLPPKRNSIPKNNTLDDVDWDKSSSDDSDWDD